MLCDSCPRIRNKRYLLCPNLRPGDAMGRLQEEVEEVEEEDHQDLEVAEAAEGEGEASRGLVMSSVSSGVVGCRSMQDDVAQALLERMGYRLWV